MPTRVERPLYLPCETCGVLLQQGATKPRRFCSPCRTERYRYRYQPLKPCRDCGATRSRAPRAGRCEDCAAARDAAEAARRARLAAAPLVPSYNVVHARLRRKKGKARERVCAGLCGAQAVEWSYNHSGVEELHELRKGRSVSYSADLEQYDPLCKPCHHLRDGSSITKEGYRGSAVERANQRRHAQAQRRHAQAASFRTVTNW